MSAARVEVAKSKYGCIVQRAQLGAKLVGSKASPSGHLCGSTYTIVKLEITPPVMSVL